MVDEVALRVTPAEAVVLFHMLNRFTATDQLTIEDPSEQQALWNLLCVLEKNGVPDWPS